MCWRKSKNKVPKACASGLRRELGLGADDQGYWPTTREIRVTLEHLALKYVFSDPGSAITRDANVRNNCTTLAVSPKLC